MQGTEKIVQFLVANIAIVSTYVVKDSRTCYSLEDLADKWQINRQLNRQMDK